MATTYELYIMSTCPYCRKVLLFMKQQGIELPLRDITAEPEARDTLERIGGKVQVPCLFIDGAPLSRTFADGAQPSITAEEQAELDNGAACPIFS